MSDQTTEATETDVPTPAPEATTAPAPAPEPAAKDEPKADPSPSDWRASISDAELRSVADRYSSPADLAKAHRELRQQLSTRVAVPGENASEEDKAAFRKALGVPEKVEDYGDVLPENLPDELKPDEAGTERLNAFVAKMHEASFTPAQVKAAVSTYFEMVQQDMDAMRAADKRFAEESEAALRREWPGEEFERNKAFASRAAQEFFGKDFEAAKQMQTSDGRFLLDNPTLLKALAKIGREMGEDRIGPSLSDGDRATLRESISDVRQKKQAAIDAGKHGEAQRLDAQERQLWEKLGNQPIVGTRGRAA